MKLNQLAAKPKLIPFTLDDEDTVKEFGEPVEFYSYDRQPLEVFMKLASAQQQDMSSMIDIVRTLILDEQGKQIIAGENMLPSTLLIRAIAKIVEKLGK
jgi:hypothetical protein